MSKLTARLDIANRALSLVFPGPTLDFGMFRGRTFYFLRPTGSIVDPSVPIMLGADGSRISFRPGQVRYTALVNEATAQLLRYLMDHTRRPLSWWAARFSGCPDVVSVLRSSDYADPTKTQCVLCGADDPMDWMGYKQYCGPCCSRFSCVTPSDPSIYATISPEDI